MPKEEIVQFAKKVLATAPDRMNSYRKDADGILLHPRELFFKANEYLNNFFEGERENRWMLIPGLRGTGKTTMLAQVYGMLREKDVPQENIVYLSVDELVKIFRSNLSEFLEAYESIIGMPLESLKDKIFLLFDEIHYDKNWDSILKILYDKSKNVFIIATGSSALALKTNPDAARRMLMERMFPLDFAEYLLLKQGMPNIEGLREKLDNALFSSESASSAYSGLLAIKKEANSYLLKIKPHELENYLLKGTLPFCFQLKQEQAFERIKQMLEKVVYEDIQSISLYDHETLDKIWNLLLILSNSEKINLDSLASRLHLSKPTVYSMLKTLEKCEIIFSVPAFGSVSKQVRKSPKYCFLTPIIKVSLLWEMGKPVETSAMFGRMLEDIAAFYLYRHSITKKVSAISHDSEKGGADFIITSRSDNSKIAIEVGYGEKGERQAKQTMKKVKAKYGLIISDNPLSISEDIVFVPKDLFLLA